MAKKIVNLILNISIVCASIILFVTIFLDIQTTVLKKTYKSFFGYSLFEIKTGSMSKTIKIGDWILVKNTKDVDLNDIITYEQNGNFITHRVIQKYQGTITTKGDSNNTIDKPITNTQVVGKVIKVLPKFGIIKSVLLNSEVLIPFIITIFIICLIIDDKNNKNESYINRFKSLFKKRDKNINNRIKDIPIPQKNDESMTTILSKVEIDNNNEVYSRLKETKNEEEDDDIPKIIKII